MFVFLFPFQSMVEKSRGNLTYLREKVYCILCYGLVLMHTVTGCNETVHCTHLVLKCIYIPVVLTYVYHQLYIHDIVPIAQEAHSSTSCTNSRSIAQIAQAINMWLFH